MIDDPGAMLWSANGPSPEQQSLLDLLSDQLPSSIWMANSAGEITYVSSNIKDLLGHSATDVLGASWLQILHPEDIEPSLQIWESSIASGQPYVNEFRLLNRHTDEYQWHDVRANPQRDSRGKIVRWVGSTLNVHRRKVTETALEKERATQALEARVLDHIHKFSPSTLIFKDITHSVDQMIPGARTSILLIQNNTMSKSVAPRLPTHYSEQLIGLGIGPDMGSCGTAAYTKRTTIVSDMFNDPRWQPFMYLIKDCPMRACWSVPILDEHDECVATFAIYYDQVRSPAPDEIQFIERIAQFVRIVIEREQQRAALRDNDERLRIIIKGTNDVIWDWDLISDAFWWSDTIVTQFGYDPDTLPKNSGAWANITHPEDLPRVTDSLQRAFKSTSQHWQDEYRIRRSDGEYRFVVDRGQIIRDNAGRAVRAIGSIIDITQQKTMEATLQHTQRLEAIGKLTGGIAHDFNNLLTVILGNAELLTESLTDDQQLRLLAEITQSAAQRGAELTSRLLAFARRQPLNPKVLNVNQLIADFEPLLRRTLGAAIDIEVVQRAGLWRALADQSQLENAILNLAINARDAMPDGGRLTIETANIAVDDDYAHQHDVDPGQYVLIAVSDTGSGIDSETLRHVFEPFYTTKEVGKGSGLGLPMVYGFVRQSNGHVRIYSEVGQGTSVRLYLPRAYEQEVDTPHHTTNAELAGGQEHILLVEDDPLVRQHVQYLLVSLGYLVTAACDGQSALEHLQHDVHRFDLLLTDVVMPGGVSGKGLAEAAAELRPGLPVLFMSGYTQNSIVHHGRLDPGVLLLQKPFRRQELANKVRTALDSGATDNQTRDE